MARITLIELALLSTPFLLFFLYRWIVASARRAAGRPISETPFQILLFIGAAGAIGALAWLALSSDEESHRGEVYIPARVVDGERIPGRYITREEAIARGILPPDRRRRSTASGDDAARDDEVGEPGEAGEAEAPATDSEP